MHSTIVVRCSLSFFLSFFFLAFMDLYFIFNAGPSAIQAALL